MLIKYVGAIHKRYFKPVKIGLLQVKHDFNRTNNFFALNSYEKLIDNNVFPGNKSIINYHIINFYQKSELDS